MNKTYKTDSIIKISDNLTVIVDREAPCPKDTWAIFPNTRNGEIRDYDGCSPILCKWDYAANGNSNLHIVATIGTERLGGIPVIEEINEIDNIESMFFKEFPIPKSHWPTNQKFDYESGRIAFIRGYKANTKQYTEEDLVNFLAWFHRNAKCISYEETVKNYIKSLSKQISEVELEYIPSKAYQRGALCSPYELKIYNKENNSIKPLSIKYHE